MHWLPKNGIFNAYLIILYSWNPNCRWKLFRVKINILLSCKPWHISEIPFLFPKITSQHNLIMWNNFPLQSIPRKLKKDKIRQNVTSFDRNKVNMERNPSFSHFFVCQTSFKVFENTFMKLFHVNYKNFDRHENTILSILIIVNFHELLVRIISYTMHTVFSFYIYIYIYQPK